jgi:hypothetical protein
MNSLREVSEKFTSVLLPETVHRKIIIKKGMQNNKYQGNTDLSSPEVEFATLCSAAVVAKHMSSRDFQNSTIGSTYPAER